MPARATAPPFALRPAHAALLQWVCRLGGRVQEVHQAQTDTGACGLAANWEYACGRLPGNARKKPFQDQLHETAHYIQGSLTPACYVPQGIWTLIRAAMNLARLFTQLRPVARCRTTTVGAAASLSKLH